MYYIRGRSTIRNSGTGNLIIEPYESSYPDVSKVGAKLDQNGNTVYPSNVFTYIIKKIDLASNSKLIPIESGVGRLISANEFQRVQISNTFVSQVYDGADPLPIDVPIGTVLEIVGYNINDNISSNLLTQDSNTLVSGDKVYSNGTVNDITLTVVEDTALEGIVFQQLGTGKATLASGLGVTILDVNNGQQIPSISTEGPGQQVMLFKTAIPNTYLASNSGANFQVFLDIQEAIDNKADRDHQHSIDELDGLVEYIQQRVNEFANILLDRSNHIGEQGIDTITGLTQILQNLSDAVEEQEIKTREITSNTDVGDEDKILTNNSSNDYTVTYLESSSNGGIVYQQLADGKAIVQAGNNITFIDMDNGQILSSISTSGKGQQITVIKTAILNTYIVNLSSSVKETLSNLEFLILRKAEIEHRHEIEDIVDLPAILQDFNQRLNDTSVSDHQHDISDVNGLQDILSNIQEEIDNIGDNVTTTIATRQISNDTNTTIEDQVISNISINNITVTLLINTCKNGLVVQQINTGTCTLVKSNGIILIDLNTGQELNTLSTNGKGQQITVIKTAEDNKFIASVSNSIIETLNTIQEELNNKADSGHQHDIDDVNNLSESLDLLDQKINNAVIPTNVNSRVIDNNSPTLPNDQIISNISVNNVTVTFMRNSAYSGVVIQQLNSGICTLVPDTGVVLYDFNDGTILTSISTSGQYQQIMVFKTAIPNEFIVALSSSYIDTFQLIQTALDNKAERNHQHDLEDIDNVDSYITNLINQRLQLVLPDILNNALDRTNHTGTQLASTISDFEQRVNQIITDRGLTSGGGTSVPYYIPENTTYVVPENNIIEYSVPIEIDGTLQVDGILVDNVTD